MTLAAILSAPTTASMAAPAASSARVPTARTAAAALAVALAPTFVSAAAPALPLQFGDSESFFVSGDVRFDFTDLGPFTSTVSTFTDAARRAITEGMTSIKFRSPTDVGEVQFFHSSRRLSSPGSGDPSSFSSFGRADPAVSSAQAGRSADDAPSWAPRAAAPGEVLVSYSLTSWSFSGLTPEQIVGDSANVHAAMQRSIQDKYNAATAALLSATAVLEPTVQPFVTEPGDGYYGLYVAFTVLFCLALIICLVLWALVVWRGCDRRKKEARRVEGEAATARKAEGNAAADSDWLETSSEGEAQDWARGPSNADADAATISHMFPEVAAN